MKKRYALMAGLLIIALSGCSLSAPSSDENAENGQQEQETTASQEAGDSGEGTASEEDTTPSIDSPIYKIVTRYQHEYYEGDYVVDNEGNSLENKPLFVGKAQALMLTDDCKDAYPALYKALYDSASDYLQGAENDAITTAQYAKEDLEYAIQEDLFFYGPYTSTNTVSIARSDEKYLSICDFGEDFSGGAHGSYGMGTVTYDVNTGAVITIDQVVNIPEEQLNSIIIDKIQSASTENDQFWDLGETLAHYRYNPDTAKGADNMENYEYAYTWYLGYDGVHFYFGPYEIGPYSNGDTDICIGYDEVDGAINEEFLPNASKGYITAVSLPQWSKESDSGLDNSPLHLVYEKEDPDSDDSDYFTCRTLTLKEKDKSATAEVYFDYNYTVNPINSYYVNTADGREYIYVSVLSYNDYTELMVFDISDDDIKLVGQDTFHYVYVDSDTDFAGELVWADPDRMCFGQVGNMLGTYTCYANYSVGADGMPVLADEEYTVSWCSEDISLAKELTVPIIDNDGNEQSKETLPVGTHITAVKTDNNTYMDCKLDDGRMIRLNYSNSDYPAEIDGIKVDELFEGLTYAG